MEIERKYLLLRLPSGLSEFPFYEIEQAYLCTDPVVRVRRQNDRFILTCKGQGMLMREECNLPMTPEAYAKLLSKAEGTVISKRRYLIPLTDGLTAELDVFTGEWHGLVMAEVEFPDKTAADAFCPPDWFGREVTFDPHFHNSWMSSHRREEMDPGALSAPGCDE